MSEKCLWSTMPSSLQSFLAKIFFTQKKEEWLTQPRFIAVQEYIFEFFISFYFSSLRFHRWWFIAKKSFRNSSWRGRAIKDRGLPEQSLGAQIEWNISLIVIGPVFLKQLFFLSRPTHSGFFERERDFFHSPKHYSDSHLT
jgi:hypothetical protein